MRTVPIVTMEPSWQLGSAFFRGVVGLGISPFAQAGLDEALGLAVGLGRIGPGADVLEAKTLAGFAEGNGLVAGAVVRHDTLDRYPEAHIVGDSRLEEGDGPSAFLVLHDLTEGDPGSVVDADMHVLTGAQVALAGSIAGDAMADPLNLPSFLMSM